MPEPRGDALVRLAKRSAGIAALASSGCAKFVRRGFFPVIPRVLCVAGL
jgi:hypothetical protein